MSAAAVATAPSTAPRAQSAANSEVLLLSTLDLDHGVGLGHSVPVLPWLARERVKGALATLRPGRRAGQPVRFLEVLRRHAPAYLLEARPAPEVARVLTRLLTCRTVGLGGHLVRCPDCGDAELLLHGCRDRHCPSCGAVRQWRWLEQRKKRALDVPHFHSVFTVAPELRPLFRANKARLYALLMQAAAATVRWAGRRALGDDVLLASTTVLHTWNRSLEYHPHVHAIVAAGGLRQDGTWVAPKGPLLPADDGVRDRFCRALLRRIRHAHEDEPLRLPAGWDEARLEAALARAAARRWYVYSKRTMRSDEAYEYIARYTSKVGLSAARLLAYDGETVTLKTKNGALELPGRELVRRFALHALPKGFVRVRYQGLFVSRHAERHAQARRSIAEQKLGCGFAAELEGRSGAAEGAQARGRGADGRDGQNGDSWQEVCTRHGFEVNRCQHCGATLEYTPFQASNELSRRFYEALFAEARARVASGPPPRPG